MMFAIFFAVLTLFVRGFIPPITKFNYYRLNFQILFRGDSTYRRKMCDLRNLSRQKLQERNDDEAKCNSEEDKYTYVYYVPTQKEPSITQVQKGKEKRLQWEAEQRAYHEHVLAYHNSQHEPYQSDEDESVMERTDDEYIKDEGVISEPHYNSMNQDEKSINYPSIQDILREELPYAYYDDEQGNLYKEQMEHETKKNTQDRNHRYGHHNDQEYFNKNDYVKSVSRMEYSCREVKRESLNKRNLILSPENIFCSDLDQIKSIASSYIPNLKEKDLELQDSPDSLENWEALSVKWNIPNFERSLTFERSIFQSRSFSVAGYIIKLELYVMEAEESHDELERDVSFFFTHVGGSNVKPVQMDGSSVTVLGKMMNNNLCLVGNGPNFKIDSDSQGYGWSGITTLRNLFDDYLTSNDSIKIEILVRVKK